MATLHWKVGACCYQTKSLFSICEKNKSGEINPLKTMQSSTATTIGQKMYSNQIKVFDLKFFDQL